MKIDPQIKTDIAEVSNAISLICLKKYSEFSFEGASSTLYSLTQKAPLLLSESLKRIVSRYISKLIEKEPNFPDKLTFIETLLQNFEKLSSLIQLLFSYYDSYVKHFRNSSKKPQQSSFILYNTLSEYITEILSLLKGNLRPTGHITERTAVILHRLKKYVQYDSAATQLFNNFLVDDLVTFVSSHTFASESSPSELLNTLNLIKDEISLYQKLGIDTSEADKVLCASLTAHLDIKHYFEHLQEFDWDAFYVTLSAPSKQVLEMELLSTWQSLLSELHSKSGFDVIKTFHPKFSNTTLLHSTFTAAATRFFRTLPDIEYHLADLCTDDYNLFNLISFVPSYQRFFNYLKLNLQNRLLSGESLQSAKVFLESLSKYISVHQLVDIYSQFALQTPEIINGPGYELVVLSQDTFYDPSSISIKKLSDLGFIDHRVDDLSLIYGRVVLDVDGVQHAMPPICALILMGYERTLSDLPSSLLKSARAALRDEQLLDSQNNILSPTHPKTVIIDARIMLRDNETSSPLCSLAIQSQILYKIVHEKLTLNRDDIRALLDQLTNNISKDSVSDEEINHALNALLSSNLIACNGPLYTHV